MIFLGGPLSGQNIEVPKGKTSYTYKSTGYYILYMKPIDEHPVMVWNEWDVLDFFDILVKYFERTRSNLNENCDISDLNI